jgi:hypothetical protein
MEVSGGLHYILRADAIRIDVPRGRGDRERTVDELRRLPSGTTVVLADATLGSRRRSRRLARSADVRIERELLAIPSVATPVYAVEDSPGAVESFWTCFATVPAGVSAPALPVAVAIRLVALLRAWALVGAAVPGRFTIGRRA